ncbi:ribonuclease BN [Kitasatospora sp. NPDC052896]|uniref:ribonuclease BN n=1 Tax=Kitasatospora sp. NPDC052896 TaxID=3364061 RepID=UPI0037C65B4D
MGNMMAGRSHPPWQGVERGAATLVAAPAAGWRRLRAVAATLWREARDFELMQRSMAFAALFFVTLVPLLIVIAAAWPTQGSGITAWISDGLGIAGRAGRPINQLFASRGQILSTTTAFSLAALAVFGASLISAMQGAYERIWHLEPGSWHTVWRQTLGLAVLTGYLVGAAWSKVPWQHSVAQPTLRIAATLIGGVLFFWWLQWLLLSARIAWRKLLPGAVATMAALAGLRFFSRWVFGPLLVSNAVSYGTVGTVLVVQSWLIGVGFTIYGGALAGYALHHAEPHRRSRPERA